VTSATAKAVASGSSCRQDDVIVAANTGRKVISDILTASKSAAYTLEGDHRERLLQAARQVGLHYRELLQFVLHAVNHPGTDVKPQLSQCSREIATAVTEIVAVGQLMKGRSDVIRPTIEICMNGILICMNNSNDSLCVFFVLNFVAHSPLTFNFKN